VNAQAIGAYVRSEGGANRGRQAYAWVSPDFEHWIQAPVESFLLPEPLDPEERSSRKPYDQVHLGIGAASFGNVLVGLYGYWHQKEYFHDISCDFGLVVSQDGLHFREPVKQRPYILSSESPATPLDGVTYPTVLCQSNGILNVGDETRIYHGRWRNARYGDDYYGETALATLPRDRWGALGLYPDQDDGEIWSAPIVLPQDGCNIVLNADGTAGLMVELADEAFAPLPAFSGENKGAIAGTDGLDLAVSWPQGSLAQLGGQRVRLKLTMQRQGETSPKLYAIYLRS